MTSRTTELFIPRPICPDDHVRQELTPEAATDAPLDQVAAGSRGDPGPPAPYSKQSEASTPLRRSPPRGGLRRSGCRRCDIAGPETGTRKAEIQFVKPWSEGSPAPANCVA